MLRKVLLISIFLLPAKAVLAGAIDFRLGGNMAELSYLSQVSSFGYGGADIGFGALVNEDDDLVGTGYILVSGSNTGDVRGLHFSVGAKGYAGALDGPHGTLNADGGAVALRNAFEHDFLPCLAGRDDPVRPAVHDGRHRRVPLHFRGNRLVLDSVHHEAQGHQRL